MRARPAIAFALLAAAAPGAGAALEFGGYAWQVRDGTGGPGPNTLAAANVSIDASGHLHLRIAHSHNDWTTAEVFTDAALGFGTYEFTVVGRPDQLDDNVVLGLFDYPTPEVGPDTTNEIDIEFATWGGSQAEHGNWTVWPAGLGTGPTTHAFDATLTGSVSVHRFTWTPTAVVYESFDAATPDPAARYATWTFAPADFAVRIPQQPLPVHMNLWLLQGKAPTDKQDVDISIAAFRFIADCLFADGFDASGGVCGG
jgi:hypothetical protein